MMQPFSSTWDDSFQPEPGPAAHWRIALPVQLEAWVCFTECDSGFGPLIFLQSSLLLSPLRARLSFTDRPEDLERASTIDVPLVSSAQRVTPPRQMVRASHPHPELQLMVRDESGEALTDYATLGTCSNGWREIDATFPVDAEVWLQVGRRTGKSRLGAPMTVRGDLHFSRGCSLRLEFHSADREPATGLDVPIAPSGRTVSFPERPAYASRQGDPYLSVELVDDTGLALGEERFLGRPS